MKLVEQHIINRNHRYYKELDAISFNSKNLYNYANYLIRQEFINNKNYLDYIKIYHLVKAGRDYKSLPAKVSNHVLRQLHSNWISFFRAIKDYVKNKSKYLGVPSLPKYKHVVTGRNLVSYEKGAISKKRLKKKGIIKLSKTKIEIKSKVTWGILKQVRVVPRYDFYVIEIVYEREEVVNKNLKAENIMSIDLGVNNLCGCSTTKGDSFLLNGRPLKSTNHYYNKKKADYQSKLTGNKKSSKRLRRLTNKRNRKIKHYLHKSSKYIINFCLTNDISKIVIGKNKNWKQEVCIGKRNNQNFVQIPFATLISQIEYKAKLQGIEVVLQEESYTSKCSALDGEPVCEHEKYLGKRIKRGLFKSFKGVLINSDINGSLNILRKAIPNFTFGENGIQGFAVSPVLINL